MTETSISDTKISTSTEDRFVRQKDLVPMERLQELHITVVGVGAIGRQVALQLAAIGATKVVLLDFDTVETTNITTQGYLQSDLGELKVEATADAMWDISPDMDIDPIPERFTGSSQYLGDVVFSCVDSISARKALWRASQSKCLLFIDGRMLGEILRVITAYNQESREHYPTTFFEESETEPGRCTARSTIYTANIAAGFMISQLAKWLRMSLLEQDFMINLLATELSITDATNTAQPSEEAVLVAN